MKRGIQIGEYVLVELLSSGGMGQVWLAHKHFAGGGIVAVAIKFPHAAGILDARIRSGLFEEGKLQMRLQHPNIPRAMDMGVHEGLPYFVMDYIAGRSLGQLLRRMREVGRPLRFEIIAHIGREIGYALRYAHTFEMAGVAQQLIHRDVAPKNVLVSGQGGVYVIDFGVSEAVGINSSRNHVKGTLMYMAPEHALGFPTPKSDGWGLGTILWEAIEGRRFRGDVDPDDMRRAANEGYCGPLTRPDIPENLRFVTEGLLRVDERDRLTLDEVLAPLEDKEFPSQRTALCDLLRRRFGVSVVRSGQTLNDFQMPEQLDQVLAAARVVKDTGLCREQESWSLAAFEAAGAPPVVLAGGTLRVPRVAALDDEDEVDDDARRQTERAYPRPERLEPTLRTRRASHEVSDREPQEKTQVITPFAARREPEIDESMVTERVPPPGPRSGREGTAPSAPPMGKEDKPSSGPGPGAGYEESAPPDSPSARERCPSPGPDTSPRIAIPQVQPWEPLTTPEADAPAFFRRRKGQTPPRDIAEAQPTQPHDDREAEPSSSGETPEAESPGRSPSRNAPGISVRVLFVVAAAALGTTLSWVGRELYDAWGSAAPASSPPAGHEAAPATGAPPESPAEEGP
ncbi:MAG: protein kinase [Myxococcales bacterium]|nr:protein kinase [Myxococcales bacterium]